MEIILVILVSILLTALCIGCFILGYRFGEKQAKKDQETKELIEKNKPVEKASDKDKSVITNGASLKDYEKDLSNILAYQGKDVDNDESE
ncbi:MAG: hypothetical protein Q4E99_03085 [Bacillota bacterium]|nr:hypothetical protein [Bacillota bacterium]